MIRALDMMNQVLRSVNWVAGTGLTTIEGTRLPTTERALQVLNYVGLALGRYIDWRWLHTRGTLETKAAYSTGTVAGTENSVVMTGTSTVWTADHVGRTFKTRNFEEVYKVRSVASATSLELDMPFHGATASGLSYTIAEDRYALPADFDSENTLLQFMSPGNIDYFSPERFDEIKFGRGHGGGSFGTSALVTGDPVAATIESESDGGLVLVFWPYPEDRRLILYSYYRELQKLDRDEDFWPFPLYVEPVIHDGTIHFLNRDARGDAPLSQMQLTEFFQNRTELAGLTRRADAFARMEPDTGIRRLKKRRLHNRLSQGVEDEWPLNAPRV